jgi:hypothetical protein
MPDSTLAGIITATATVITALGGLVLAMAVLIPTLRNAKAAKEAAVEANIKTDQVHTMVNQQRTDMMRQMERMASALQNAGITIPEDKSLH